MVGNKTFYKLPHNRQGANESNFGGAPPDATTNDAGAKSIENLQNQTWTSSFEPLVLNQTGPFNFKVSASNTMGLSSSNFYNASAKFNNRKQRVESRQSVNANSFEKQKDGL